MIATANPTLSGYYPRLKKRLWMGTLLVNLLMIAMMLCVWPAKIRLLLLGMAMGAFYLWSLSFNAEHPKKKIQFVFSLIRILVLAYAMVTAAHARVSELAIVMSGLLSYKVILTLEYIAQAASCLQGKKRGNAV